MSLEGDCDMKVHFKFDEPDPKDTRFAVVIDDARLVDGCP